MSLFKRRTASKEDYFEALILVLSVPRIIEKQTLTRLLSPDDVGVMQEDERLHAIGPTYVLNVWAMPTPYPPGRKADFLAGRANDLRLRDHLLEHNAFISIYLDELVPGPIRADSELASTKLAGALIDETVLAVLDAGSGRVIVPTAESIKLLQDGNRDEALKIPGIEGIRLVKSGSLDGEMSEAKRRFPEFVAAFQKATAPDPFLVKMEFIDPISKQSEHMWILVAKVSESQVTGTLESSPRYVRSLRRGQTVTKSVADLSDWVFKDESGSQGLFTERAL